MEYARQCPRRSQRQTRDTTYSMTLWLGVYVIRIISSNGTTQTTNTTRCAPSCVSSQCRNNMQLHFKIKFVLPTINLLRQLIIILQNSVVTVQNWLWNCVVMLSGYINESCSHILLQQ